MEIIQLSGYTTEEKVEIAKKHLISKQLEKHGLKSSHISLSKAAITQVIQEYTREAGVRSLDRTIGSLMRNIAKKIAMDESYDKKLSSEVIREILGPAKVILFIEAIQSKGKGKLNLTGNLGNVMKESASTALSYVKAHSEALGIDTKVFEESDIHIHVPEGAVPKDGPSAGITMLTAITSALKGKKVKSNLAMTGEITLRGRVLPVGGIKEKILAAKRAGIREIIMSNENKKHVDEIEAQYIKGLKFHFVERMSEVLEIALGMKNLDV